MSNASTVTDAILQQNNGQPITLAATTSLHQSFQLKGGTVNITVPNPMACIDSQVLFPSRSAAGLTFVVRAAGLVTGGERYQIDINQGTGLTNTIASTGLALNGLTADNWALFAVCLWDPISLNLRGIYYGWSGNQQVAQAALVTSTQPANLAALTFNCAVTIANSNPNALFTLTDFSCDLE
jgi:hypothetical protein